MIIPCAKLEAKENSIDSSVKHTFGRKEESWRETFFFSPPPRRIFYLYLLPEIEEV